MRAVVYTRQSFDKSGEGAAVARQLEDCQKLADLRGWTVVDTFSDNDISAAGKKWRPGFEAALEALAADRATVVVAWALDRLTRNRRDELRLVELCEAKSATIALVRGTDLDMSTPGGILVADVMGAAARHEIKQKGDRQKRAQQQAAEQGRPAGGRRAFGYAANGQDLVDGEVKLVVEAYADLLAGASLKGIARRWNESGVQTTACRNTLDHGTHECIGEPCTKRSDHSKHHCEGGSWRHDNVREVLKNARYAGLRTYRGEIVGDATWQAVVDVETYEAALGLLSMPERRTTATTARKHLLPAIALCWKCGSDVATGHTRHGKRVYVCRANKCISRAAEPVDDLIERVMVARLSRPDAVELLSEPSTPDLEQDKAQAAAIRERIDNLATGLEEGILTLGAARKSSERLRKELALVEGKIQNSATADVLTPLVTADDVAAAWDACDLAQKRSAIEALMTVTLLAPPRGRREFDPNGVKIEWM